jgi:NADH:ubiquinone oxidoreductase subunit E/NAD-dependent dihydropyrimidine dehydrogenase PreA subunit
MKNEKNPPMTPAKHGSVLVLGGGIAGIQSALDLADAGFKVYLVEKQPSIGGTMPQLDKTFPTNDCAMCILAPKLVATGRHPNIELITYSDLKKIEGEPGDFTVTINKKARSVDETLCNGCGLCVENCLVRFKPQKPKDHDAKKNVSKDDLKTINDIIQIYGKSSDMLIPIMQAINEHYNYLPKNILQYVAQELKVPLSQVYHVATFYTSFTLKPRGKHIIKVCMGTACHVRGSPRVLDEIQRYLKIEPDETTDDGMFTLETVNCLGACALGPVVVVDEKYYMVKPGEFDKILKSIITEKSSVLTTEVKI